MTAFSYGQVVITPGIGTNQQLSHDEVNHILSLTSGGNVNLSQYLDNDNVVSGSLTGSTLTLNMAGGGTVPIDLGSLPSGTPTTDASDLTTGVLADPRVQESNVTQHQSALSIAKSQIPGLTDTDDQQITGFSISSNIATLELENGGTGTIDLSPYLDNKNVASGVLTGTDLVLTLTDTTTVTIDLNAFSGGTDDQNASEVPYTNNGQTTTEGALDDLYSSTVSFSGIDHTDDFTISDTDIGKVHNIIINAPDSIVVTYPNNLTVFGFTKFVVKGTGFVAFDMDDVTTTRGSFKTPSGRGESSTVRNYSATEADVLNASQLLAYVPAPAIPPTLLNAGTMSVASLTPTIDVAYPTVSNGDYMLLHIVTRANGVVLNTGITTPDGWSLIHYEDEATESSGTSSLTHAVYGRFSDGSQTGNLTVSFTTNNPNSSTARISTWGGVNVSNPFNLIGDGILGTYDLSTTGIPIPAVTTTNGTTAIAMIGFNDTLALTQAPTNYTTQVYDEGTSAGSDSRIGAWYIPINADGSIGADSAKYSTTLIAEGIVIQLNGQ